VPDHGPAGDVAPAARRLPALVRLRARSRPAKISFASSSRSMSNRAASRTARLTLVCA